MSLLAGENIKLYTTKKTYSLDNNEIITVLPNDYCRLKDYSVSGKVENAFMYGYFLVVVRETHIEIYDCSEDDFVYIKTICIKLDDIFKTKLHCDYIHVDFDENVSIFNDGKIHYYTEDKTVIVDKPDDLKHFAYFNHTYNGCEYLYITNDDKVCSRILSTNEIEYLDCKIEYKENFIICRWADSDATIFYNGLYCNVENDFNLAAMKKIVGYVIFVDINDEYWILHKTYFIKLSTCTDDLPYLE